MRTTRRSVLAAIAGAALTRPARAAVPKIRVGVLRFGSVAWELDVIRTGGFDAEAGVAIEIVDLASAQATQVALQAGAVDTILLDWLWVARQRATGADWTCAPTSAAVGGVVVPEKSSVNSPGDLVGKRLGIAGTSLDKSWLILRAFARETLGFDLDERVEKSFGPPPLLEQQLLAGRLDAALTYWPYVARGEAVGLRTILSVEDAVKALGIPPGVPFTGYTMSAGWAGRNRAAVDGFLAASARARAVLATSDDAWRRIAPLTGAVGDAELNRLKVWVSAGHHGSLGRGRTTRCGATLRRLGQDRRRSPRRPGDVPASRDLLANFVKQDYRLRSVRLASFLMFFLVWEIVARLADSRMLPPASTICSVLVHEIATGALPLNFMLTLSRAACAFAVSMVLGVGLGLAMGRWRVFDAALDGVVTGLLNVPALVLIVLVYVWFGLSETSAIVAVALNKLPSTAVTIRQGTRALDPGLREMAQSFRMSRYTILRHVLLPELAPYLFVATRSGSALIWKIVLVAELLGRSNGVGFQIGVYFQLFDVAGILAYTFTFIAMIQMLEWVALQPAERWIHTWR